MRRSKRDLKKKKEAQEVALPMRFGVRPRYKAARGRSVCVARLRKTETVVSAADGLFGLLRWTVGLC